MNLKDRGRRRDPKAPEPKPEQPKPQPQTPEKDGD